MVEILKRASFGSISTGTLRPEDLADSFRSELEYHLNRNAESFCSDEGRAERDKYLKLCGEAQDFDFDDGDADEASEIVNELQEALQDFAPAYAYFGSHPGDGADFGFWLSESFREDFDGLEVADTSEVPDDYSGEVLHVNDHGNMTLYVADTGKLTEVWGIV